MILKTKVYSHNLVRLVVIIIVGIILIVINYYDKYVNFLKGFITLMTEIFYCLENNLAKLAMDAKYISPYQICFDIGVIELIIFIILLIIFTNVSLTGTENMNYLNKDYIDNFYVYID